MAKRKLPLDLATATLPQLQEFLKKAEDTTYVLELAVTLRNNPEVEDDLTAIVAYVVDLKATLKQLKAQAPTLSPVDVQVAQAKLKAQILVNEGKAKSLEGATDLRSVNLRNIYLKSVEALTKQLTSAGLPPAVVLLKEQYTKILDLLTAAVIEWKSTYPTLELEQLLPEAVNILPHLFGKANDSVSNVTTTSSASVPDPALQQGVTGG